MADIAILNENLHYYKRLLTRIKDDHEKLIIEAAIVRTSVRIEQTKADKVSKNV